MPKVRAKSKRRASRRRPSIDSAPSPSLTEQAYQAIKERIVTLVFTPGQYLNEAAICHALDMGRTPVHQALLRLNVEGLVEVVPRKGIIVLPDSIGHVIEMLDARRMIEPELARRAAENATDDDVAYLENVLRRPSHEPSLAGFDTYASSDRDFHVKIAAMSGNQVLGDFLQSLHERVARFWYLHLWRMIDTGRRERDHGAVLEAIRARAGEEAAEAMEAHIERLRGQVVEIRETAPRTIIHRLYR
jgi:DNA-binding GntR family transcriptional regulator